MKRNLALLLLILSQNLVLNGAFAQTKEKCVIKPANAAVKDGNMRVVCEQQAAQVKTDAPIEGTLTCKVGKTNKTLKSKTAEALMKEAKKLKCSEIEIEVDSKYLSAIGKSAPSGTEIRDCSYGAYTPVMINAAGSCGKTSNVCVSMVTCNRYVGGKINIAGLQTHATCMATKDGSCPTAQKCYDDNSDEIKKHVVTSNYNIEKNDGSFTDSKTRSQRELDTIEEKAVKGN